MTYLIGLILILLFIALLLVLRPPKVKPRKDVEERGTPAKSAEPAEERLSIDETQVVRGAIETEEELELTLDESDETEVAETGMSEEEEVLELSLDEPATVSSETAEDIEELELDLTVDIEEVDREEVSEEPAVALEHTDEPAAVTEDRGRDEYDEDIPFIEESDDEIEHRGEMAPALADVPEGYAGVTDEDETPEELAERLEYFLGTGDAEEQELEIEVPADEGTDESSVIEEEAETVEEKLEAEQVVEAVPELNVDTYQTHLNQLEKRLRSEMDTAIQNRESLKLSALSIALEDLCIRQADVSKSFQLYTKQLEELESVMSELQQALPGFQLETAQAALYRGEYEVVRTMLTEAADQLDNAPQLATKIFFHCGQLEEEQGEFASALDMYGKANNLDEANPDCLYVAGRMARIMGDVDSALALLEKRVAAGQEQGEESVELARAEHELAKALVMADDEKDRTEQLLIHAKERMEKMLGSDHPDLGPVLHDLAVFNDSSGRYEQAEPLYKKALEVIEKGSGNESPSLGATLNKLAGLYVEIEMEKKAEPLYLKALEIRQKVLGDNHPDVGSIMGHVANLLKMQGKHDQAESMYKKSLEIAEVALGKDHPNLSVIVNDMAELYSEMGNEEMAEKFQERAFSLFGLPGMGDGFVEMEKDTGHDPEDENDQTVAGG